MESIPFNKPFLSGKELENVNAAYDAGILSGNGPFSKTCEKWLKADIGCAEALMTHSCTAALEMTALILDLKPGDEVIMPSFTFVSTANAFALRGAVPVFVDIRPDTLNLDERLIEDAITDKTRVICVVHYAGVGAEMDDINAIAARHGIAVIEDAAQGIASRYKGKALGAFGRFGALSFHETKNATCGEGGALLLNDSADVELAEILREKGTDRSKFMRGHIDKYSWRAVGSSFLLGEMASAFLKAQLDIVGDLTRKRLSIWQDYNDGLSSLERNGRLARPSVPEYCQHNAHMYYVLANSPAERNRLIDTLQAQGIGAVFHYVPLHSSEAGRRVARTNGDLSRTVDLAARIIRLPMWVGLQETQIERVCESLTDALN